MIWRGFFALFLVRYMDLLKNLSFPCTISVFIHIARFSKTLFECGHFAFFFLPVVRFLRTSSIIFLMQSVWSIKNGLSFLWILCYIGFTDDKKLYMETTESSATVRVKQRNINWKVKEGS